MNNLVENTEGYFRLLGINPYFELATKQLAIWFSCR